MLSQTTAHALRAMLFLSRDGGGMYRPAHSIAEAVHAPPRYLSKTLGSLVSAGLLEATRGPGGGVRLARPAGRITIAEVMGVFEDRSKPGPCLLATDCGEEEPCDSHRLWLQLEEQARGPFEQTTLEELARGMTHDGGKQPA